jgi:hypothetical protein
VKALSNVYPDHQWQPWKSNQVTKEYWTDTKHQRHFFEWLAAQFGVKQPEDWFFIKPSEIRKKGGDLLLALYKGSMFKALSSAFPEHTNVVHGIKVSFWENVQNQRKHMDSVASQLNITHPEAWYSVTISDLNDIGADSLLDYYQYPNMKIYQQIVLESSMTTL